MYSSLTRRKRLLIDRFFPDQIQLSIKRKSPSRNRLSIYVKSGLCILILYYLNIYFGFKSSIWFERSFEDEYHLTMTQIDITKIEENVEEILGPPINLISNEFLISNEYFCGRSLDPDTRILPHLLILIKSFPQNVKERQSIRLTWGNKDRLLKFNIRLAFVLGVDVDNTSVEEESKKYGDIIQIDKIDYYYYSSYKMLMMFRWIKDYCSSKSSRLFYMDLRRYVLFVDDNYYIDLELLLLYLQEIDEDQEMTTYERRTFLTGQFIEKSRPERFVNDRWYISLIDYPYNKYPPYLSSECFLMTRYNVRLFDIASKYTRLFHFDHIYIGLLAYSMSINPIQNNQLFSTSISKKKIFNNQTEIFAKWKQIFKGKLHSNSTKRSICYRGYRNEELIQLWNQIHQTNFTFSFD